LYICTQKSFKRQNLNIEMSQEEIRSDSRKLTALVAGGAGFIGSNLCDRLVKDGYNVLCIDNLYTGCTENIKHLLNFRK